MFNNNKDDVFKYIYPVLAVICIVCAIKCFISIAIGSAIVMLVFAGIIIAWNFVRAALAKRRSSSGSKENYTVSEEDYTVSDDDQPNE